MPRFPFYLSNNADPGHLEIEEPSEDKIVVFYVPSEGRIAIYLDDDEEADVRVKLIAFDLSGPKMSIFPIHARGNPDDMTGKPNEFLQSKYPRIQQITIADGNYIGTDIVETALSTEDDIMMMLEDLPPCFLKDYDSGLGFAPPYKVIIDVVEELSKCKEILIDVDCETGPDDEEETFFIATKDFEWIRKFINRTATHSQNAARSVKRASTFNFLAGKLGKPLVEVEVGRSTLRKQFTEALIQGEDTLSPADQALMVEVLTKHTNSIVKAKPEKLTSLKRNIELVTLDDLIGRYEEMIALRLPEKRWQTFFEENAFLLSLAFGYPILKVKEQPSVGGHTISGSGEKIPDFLVKNSLTNNCAIIEIKTPQASLLNSTPIRTSVYVPSSELVGAVNQALDQKYHFDQEIAQKKSNSRIYDIESYSVHCYLIVGRLPAVEDEKKSFELYRGNSKNVVIVTFDELLEKLKQLRELLAVEDEVAGADDDALTGQDGALITGDDTLIAEFDEIDSPF